MSKRASLPLPRWPLIPSRLAFKASASVMRESLPQRMQIQEMNLKVNGVFVPMISTLPLFCMTLFICTIKQIIFGDKKSKLFFKSYNNYHKTLTSNYFLFRVRMCSGCVSLQWWIRSSIRYCVSEKKNISQALSYSRITVQFILGCLCHFKKCFSNTKMLFAEASS